VPCLTLRATTERPVTVTQGTNRLAPWPLSGDGIVAAARERLARGRSPVGAHAPPGWDGRAAFRIVDALLARA
jgi:UDP-N-acetylglucosamine 2-epimerase (non-hydrolysing)